MYKPRDQFYFGFCCSRSSSFFEDSCQSESNLASTYSALVILKVVGYDSENFDSRSILESMRNLQMLARTLCQLTLGLRYTF
jgi:hypothetical protein